MLDTHKSDRYHVQRLLCLSSGDNRGAASRAILAIGIGGFIGANVRYWLSSWIGDHLGRSYPWGTYFVNLTGSFLLAVFAGWEVW